jgi:tRNA A37 methylthiotransferase MiaB
MPGFRVAARDQTGTAAHRAFPDTVSREEKKRRWQVVQAVMERIVKEENQQLVGKTVRVLVETVTQRPSVDLKTGATVFQRMAEGNNEYMKRTRFVVPNEMDDLSVIGSFFSVRVTRAMEWVLDGVIV